MQPSADNFEAAKLEAILCILLGAETDDELEEAKKQAAALAEMEEDDIGRNEPARFARGNFLTALQFEAPRVPAGQKIDGMHGGQWVMAQALAEFYAELFNDLAEAGSPVEDDQVEGATDELEPHGWTLDRDEEDLWEAVPVEDLEEEAVTFTRRGRAYQYGAKRMPAGQKMTIAGKTYKGGMFIPSKVMEQATPEQKEAIEEGEKKAEAKRQGEKESRKNRGAVDTEKLKSRLKEKAGESELTVGERKRARSSLRLLLQHHGGLAVHRLEELAGQVEETMDGLEEDSPVRERLARKMAMLHSMVDLAKEEGITGTGDETYTKTSAPKSPTKGKTYDVALADLHVDPKRFQYKLNTNAEGVTQELKSVETFNPDFAGVISVWRDPKDGKTYVVNGHHRTELARRLGHPSLAVRYLEEPDEKKARAMGALINIAEGRGTAVDAAKFLRDYEIPESSLKKYGVSLKGKLAQDAAILTKLNDRIFQQVTMGTFDLSRALSIAAHCPNPDLQDLVVSQVEKYEDRTGQKLSDRTVAEMSRQVASAPTTKTVERDLFGEHEKEESLFVPMMEMQGHIRAELAKIANDFAALSSERRAEATKGAGNVLNTEQNKTEAQKAEQVKNVFDTLVKYKGNVKDAIEQAAREYVSATSQKQRQGIRDKALKAVRSAVEQELDNPSLGQQTTPPTQESDDGTLLGYSGDAGSPEDQPPTGTADAGSDLDSVPGGPEPVTGGERDAPGLLPEALPSVPDAEGSGPDGTESPVVSQPAPTPTANAGGGSVEPSGLDWTHDGVDYSHAHPFLRDHKDKPELYQHLQEAMREPDAKVQQRIDDLQALYRTRPVQATRATWAEIQALETILWERGKAGKKYAGETEAAPVETPPPITDPESSFDLDAWVNDRNNTPVTDPAEKQELKNSIAEGKLILQSGAFNGRKLSPQELLAVRRSVENSLARIGESRIAGKEVSPKIASGFTVEDVTPPGYGPEESSSPPDSLWQPATHLKIAADSPPQLRRQDVFRVLDQAPPEKRQEMAQYLQSERPDLHDEVSEVMGELGDEATVDDRIAAAKKREAETPKATQTKPIDSGTLNAIRDELRLAVPGIRVVGAKTKSGHFQIYPPSTNPFNKSQSDAVRKILRKYGVVNAIDGTHMEPINNSESIIGNLVMDVAGRHPKYASEDDATEKPVWQIPQHEYVASHTKNSGAIGTGQLADMRASKIKRDAHRSAVESALAAGKPVPPEVLKDYPDLQAKQNDPRVSSALERYDNRGNLPQVSGALFGGDDVRSRERFDKLPDGVRVVLTEGDRRGQVGSIRRQAMLDGSTQTLFQPEGSEERFPVAHTAVEPLDPSQSWRTETGAQPNKQSDLFSGGEYVSRMPQRAPGAEEGAEPAPKEESKPDQETEPATQDGHGAKLEDIPFRAALDAHRWHSFVPEERAKQRQRDYLNQMSADYDHLLKLADSDEKKQQLQQEFQRYREGYKKHYLDVLHAASRTASPMITGPAKFPNERNQKRLETEARRRGDLIEFRKRAMAAIQKKLSPESGPILASDPQAVDSLKKQLDNATKVQELMNNVNAIVRKHSKYVSGRFEGGNYYGGKTEWKAGKNEQTLRDELRSAGVSDKVIDGVLQPNHMGKIGFEPFQLSNNNANIQRIRTRIDELQKMKESPAKEESYSGDVRVSEDPEAARIRIHFPGKPSKEKIAELKTHGFRWSPTENAWQRHLNNAGRYAVESVLKKFGHTKMDSHESKEDALGVPDLILPEETDDNPREVVARAVSAGESVPDEILADYPDLAEKYGSKPQQSSRSGQARRYLRLAESAEQFGDRASAAIYRKQARQLTGR